MEEANMCNVIEYKLNGLSIRSADNKKNILRTL